MAEEVKKQGEGLEERPDKEQQAPAGKQYEAVSADRIKQALEVLNDLGSFDIVATTVKGAENMEPGAMKEVFLGDQEMKEERNRLKKRLDMWIDLLSSTDNVGLMIEKSNEVAQQSKQLLQSNLKRALDRTRHLEQNYRTVQSFFVNAGGDNPVKLVTIMNASMDNVADLDTRRFLDVVAKEFKDKYDRLDLMNNYSMLVIPGFMESKTVIDEWARIAADHKVMLVTDFRNLESTDQVMKLFERGKFTGSDEFRANVMMTCNWLVGREKYVEAGEEEPVFLPPSAALAGKMYSGNMAQVSAGVENGVVRGFSNARFIIYANDLAKLGDMGLIPMAQEYGQVQAMSKSTLFNGTNLGMQTYSVVRTFDWLTKCLMDYLNRQVFTNIDVNKEMEIQLEISRFIDKCSREYKYLEKVGKVMVKRDPNQRDQVHVYVHATPYFPAKNFVLRLDGKSGANPGDANDYAALLEQA